MRIPALPSFIHSFDPFAVQISASFGIRWYSLAYLAGFMFGFYFIARIAKAKKTPLPQELVGDFVFWVALGTIIGGRLGFCILYSPRLFTTWSSTFPFWGVLALNEGGMASHGGIIGVAVACLLFARKHTLPFLALLDLNAVAGGVGIFFGRIANFINGELVGRASDPNLPWGVKFPQDILSWPAYEPARLVTLAPVVRELGISEQAWANLVSTGGHFERVQSVLLQIVHAVQHGNGAVTAVLSPLLVTRHPSQLYEALLEGAFLCCVCLFLWRRQRAHGVIAAWFLTLYPIVRIAGEQFRMPDIYIGFEWFGLTRGQWLSVLMLMVSVPFLLWRLQAERS